MPVIDDAAPAVAGNDVIAAPGRRRWSLWALELGTFCIGTTEFASMGMIQLFSAELGIDIPTATHAITAYAMSASGAKWTLELRAGSRDTKWRTTSARGHHKYLKELNLWADLGSLSLSAISLRFQSV